MRRFAPLCIAVLVFACAKKEAPPADTGMAVAPAPEAAPPAAAPVSLKDVAGTYTVTGKNEAGDSTLVTYELNTTDTAGWTIKFPNRAKTEKVRIISVAGDSIVTEAGPYPSAIRKGATVTTHGVYRLQDGKLVGRTVAHYNIKGPDSVLIVISEGVRK
ncbi:MAG TPA: hypothetical protein VIF83_14620 [Gemmatimonadaceae bacterium]|jgi:hypothetical protein